jgi:uncharacterized protein (UPF0248 family)
VLKKNDEDKQKWSIVYLDEADKEQEKGMSKEWGFRVGESFYLRSRMPFHRVADLHGNNYVYLRRWVKNRTSQQWYFDMASKTLKSVWKKGQSFQINSTGNHPYMGSGATLSRWW